MLQEWINRGHPAGLTPAVLRAGGNKVAAGEDNGGEQEGFGLQVVWLVF